MGAGPIDFLVVSTAICYLITIVGILVAQKIEVIDLNLKTKTDPKQKNLLIHHFIEFKVSADINDDQIKVFENMINKADCACHVGNMLRKADVEIHVQGSVVQA